MSLNNYQNKAGLPPGSLIHVGKRKADNVRISIIEYNKESYTEKEYNNIDDALKHDQTNSVFWLNIDGLHDTELIQKIGNHFNLHPLLLEDILNTNHRPKTESFTDHLFLTLKMLGIGKKSSSIVYEQVSFVMGQNWIISFQEKQGDIFNPIRERIRENLSNIRKNGVDYLLYRLADTVVDNYFFVTDYYDDKIESLDERVLTDSNDELLKEIQQVKKQLIYLRKSTSPLREVVSALEKESSNLIKKTTTQYLRDVYEHIIQINDMIDSQRDLLSGIMDLHMSGVSNRMNEVMKVLTIIATIFIPLTFIAGIYGMNFDNMPELHMKHGYLGVWILMAIIFIAMIIYFKRKKWL